MSDPFIVNPKYCGFEFTKIIDAQKNFYNQMKVFDACKMAEDMGLNLVCFNKPTDKDLAFCKIIDFNKWKYEEEKNKKKMEKLNKRQNKEIRFSPVIDDHDIEHKMRQANEFLDDGNDVTLTMKLKGREKIHFAEAELKMNKIVSMCNGHGKESSRKKNGSMIIVHLSKVSAKEKTEKVEKAEIENKL